MSELTLKQMVDEYNKLTGKNIKKFSSRAAGERQLAKLKGSVVPTDVFVDTKPKRKPKVEPPVDAARSAAIKKSWSSKKTAVARATKHGIKVDGHGEYKSMLAAFNDLHLPVGRHIRLRGIVKKEGIGKLEHGGKTLTFRLLER